MTDRPRITLEGKSIAEYFEQTIENKKLKDKLYAKEKECEKAKKIIETAVNDFNLEYGTPQYDRLLNGAKSLGIEVKDYE